MLLCLLTDLYNFTLQYMRVCAFVPLQLTKPVFELLDRVANVSNNDLANAQALVSNVSSSVRQMSSSIQSAALDKVDSFQTSYLGKKNSSSSAKQADKGADRLVKAVHTVYYVSHTCAHACCCKSGMTQQVAHSVRVAVRAGHARSVT